MGRTLYEQSPVGKQMAEAPVTFVLFTKFLLALFYLVLKRKLVVVTFSLWQAPCPGWVPAQLNLIYCHVHIHTRTAVCRVGKGHTRIQHSWTQKNIHDLATFDAIQSTWSWLLLLRSGRGDGRRRGRSGLGAACLYSWW